MHSTTLLTQELDSALDVHDKQTQGSEISQKFQKFSYSFNHFFSPSWDPLKKLDDEAPLAFVEAAAKNDLARVKRLLPFVKSDAKYLALVGATQSSHDEMIDFLLNLSDIEAIIQNEISFDTINPAEKKIAEIDFKDPQNLRGLGDWQKRNKLAYFTYGVAGRLGFNERPNILIDASCAGRLDVIMHLQQFYTVKSRLFESNYCYYVCLRAAEEGHLHILNKLLENPKVLEEVRARKEILLYAGIQGQLKVVERLLELPIRVTLDLLQGVLKCGRNAEVIERLLKIPQVESWLSYDGEDRLLKHAIEQCAINACYTDSYKGAQTASRMFQLLLNYPLVAKFAKTQEHVNNDANPVWYIMDYLNKSNNSSIMPGVKF